MAITASLLSKVAVNGGTGQGTDETAFTKLGVTPAAAAVTYIPGFSDLANRVIHIVASGRVTGGSGVSATIALYLQNATTLTSGNKIATTGAISASSASSGWCLDVLCVIDSTSKTLSGVFSGWLNRTAVAETIVSNAVSQDPTGASLPVMASSDFSGADAANVATLDQLDVTVI